MDNGFPNPRSFTTLFKREYDTLPSHYRKLNQENATLLNPASSKSQVNYLDFERHNYLNLFAKYLPKEDNKMPTTEPLIQSIPIFADVSAKTLKLKNTFKTFTSVAKAKDILLAPIQKMLKTMQNEIGFKYIKFHGILGDDLMVYDEDTEGNPLYNFSQVDMVIEISYYQ